MKVSRNDIEGFDKIERRVEELAENYLSERNLKDYFKYVYSIKHNNESISFKILCEHPFDYREPLVIEVTFTLEEFFNENH